MPSKKLVFGLIKFNIQNAYSVGTWRWNCAWAACCFKVKPGALFSACGFGNMCCSLPSNEHSKKQINLLFKYPFKCFLKFKWTQTTNIHSKTNVISVYMCESTRRDELYQNDKIKTFNQYFCKFRRVNRFQTRNINVFFCLSE